MSRWPRRHGKAHSTTSTPNLEPFFDRGGKLIRYHGWADPRITPGVSINYYNNVAKQMGGVAKIDDKLRLFMVPGMLHCGGGDGTSTFDMLAAIEQWVEHGKAPATIPASKVENGKVDAHASALSVPEGSRVQRHRQHRRRGELRVPGEMKIRESEDVRI